LATENFTAQGTISKVVPQVYLEERYLILIKSIFSYIFNNS